jgi:hypothetical protein
MPSDADSVDIPSEVASVVQRDHRIERPVSWAMGLFVSAVVVTDLFSLPLIPALLVAIGLLALVRFPVLRSYGTITLEANADAETVRADFESATPPSLVFQWGLASTIQSVSNGWVYEISYLFGLRTVRMTVEIHPFPSGDDESNADFELVMTVDERPWGTYTVSLHEGNRTTEIYIEYVSDRRFGLRQFPQWLVAKRYRDESLTAQGYEIIERKRNLGL